MARIKAATDLQSTSLAKTLIKLDEAIGVSGNEEEVIAALRAEMDSESGLYDEYDEDPLGNQYYIKKGTGAGRVLLAAHMDEIGFIINYIDDDGFARIMPVGYHDDRMIVNQDLVFLTASGEHVYGVTGAKPAHLAIMEDHDKVIPIKDLYVDFGTASRAETNALGIEEGDYGTFNRKGYFLNTSDYYSGKWVDDRSALAVLVEVLRRLKGKRVETTVCMAGTVQEEVGMRGGGPAARRFKPDFMLSVDVTLTGGTPGLEYREASQKMGGGVSIKMFDWDMTITCGTNVRRKVTNYLIGIAKKHSIPFQRETMLGGGTDSYTAAIAGSGILAGGLGIPSRYIHTAVSTVKLSDMEHLVSFLVAMLEEPVLENAR